MSTFEERQLAKKKAAAAAAKAKAATKKKKIGKVGVGVALAKGPKASWDAKIRAAFEKRTTVK